MRGAAQSKSLVLALLLALGGAGVLFAWQRPTAEPLPLALEEPTPLPTLTVGPTATPGPIVVFVSGAVQQPGVYTLPATSRVVDALEAAGGPTDEAAIESLNQATLLADGMQIHMPERGSAPPPPAAPVAAPNAGAGAGTSSGALVRLNSADAATLETLPGIGPALAARIVEFREANGPFTSIEQLLDVRGIGENVLSQIRDHIVLD